MKETEESERWSLAVCGLNCDRCNIFQVFKNKDIQLQLQISKEIFGDDADNVPEGITCEGCRGDPDVHWSPNCRFKSCAEERGLQYCLECNDFPCDKLEQFASDGFAHHRLTVENMKRMKAIGLDAWIAEQKKCMFCPGWIL